VPKAGIIYNDAKPLACEVALEIQRSLYDRGWEVAMATGSGGLLGCSRPEGPFCHTSIEQLCPPGFDATMKFAIVLGGDGTVLSAFRQVASSGVPLLTINTGHMGFLTESYVKAQGEFSACFLAPLLAGDYEIESRTMLTVQLLQGDSLLWEALCLNEAVIHREPLTSMCHFEITVGRYQPVDIAADGVIISTPTGSTAYSLSAGGPVITPDVPVMELVPICPHSLASRALVFANTEIVQILPASPGQLIMTVDGNAGCYVRTQDRVQIQKSQYEARFIRLRPPEFFHLLREKLGWGLPHVAKPSAGKSKNW